MVQIDEVIQAHGGWPGAFSQNHLPPDAATLAAEQAVFKAQQQAQKKAAKKQTVKAAGASGNGDLFDDALDDLAAASGVSPRPKANATPTTPATPASQAAGGKNAAAAVRNADQDADGRTMCAIRKVLARDGALSRANLIRAVARELGYARTGEHILAELESALRRAVRRGIAANERGNLTLATRTVGDHDPADLEAQLHRGRLVRKGGCTGSLRAHRIDHRGVGLEVDDSVTARWRGRAAWTLEYRRVPKGQGRQGMSRLFVEAAAL